MSPTSKTLRRHVVTAAVLALVVGLAVWLLGSDDQDAPDAPATSDQPVVGTESTPDPAPKSGPTPESAPSSGPTSKPSPGSLEVVPVKEARTKPPVPLTEPADFDTGMTLRIERIESVQGVARGTGEVAGPALRLTLRMSNGSDSAVSLESAVVDLTTGADRTPAPTLTDPGGRPFVGEVPPGGSRTGVYVFAVPEDERDQLRVTVSYVGDAPVVVLAGAAG